MADYISTTELDLFLLGAAAANSDKKVFAVTAASRAFDRLAGVADDYFAPAAESALEKILRGSGSSILSLPPFVGALGAVVFENGTDSEETVDAGLYTLQGDIPNQFLETFPRRSVDSFGWSSVERLWRPELGWHCRSLWRENASYTITARWGWAATPKDVKTAVIQLAIAIVRDLDFGKAVALESERDAKDHLPENSLAALTANKYRAAGIGGLCV